MFTFTRRRVEKQRRAPVPRQTATYTIADRYERRMARKVLQALKAQRERINIRELAKVVETAFPDEVYRAASAGGSEALAVQIQADQMEALKAGGDAAGRAAAGPNVVIDLSRPGVAEWLKVHTAEFVTRIDDTQREAVRQILERGLLGGRHPMRISKDIKEHIGLTGPQEAALEKYRDRLRIEGRPAAQVERMAARYEEKKLKERAVMIARTESMSAVSQGRAELWGQLAESGALPATVEREWETARDERVCPICGPMHRQSAPLGVPWVLPNGRSVMIPQQAHPQ